MRASITTHSRSEWFRWYRRKLVCFQLSPLWLYWRVIVLWVLCWKYFIFSRCLWLSWPLNLPLMSHLSFHCLISSGQRRIRSLCYFIATFLGKFGYFFIKSSQDQLFFAVQVPSHKGKTVPSDIIFFLDHVAPSRYIEQLDVIGVRQDQQTVSLVFKTDMVDPPSYILDWE